MNKFKSLKKEKSILDCFTYNLKAFFHDKYEEIDSEETPATVMLVYEKQLDWKEFNIFDIVQFRVFFDKENLTGSNPVNVKFISKDKSSSLESLKSIIEKLHSIYGDDDLMNSKWNEEDDNNYSNKEYRRIWTIEGGESFASVEFKESEGVTLNILFFNNILNPHEEEENNTPEANEDIIKNLSDED